MPVIAARSRMRCSATMPPRVWRGSRSAPALCLGLFSARLALVIRVRLVSALKFRVAIRVVIGCSLAADHGSHSFCEEQKLIVWDLSHFVWPDDRLLVLRGCAACTGARLQKVADY